MSKIKLPHASGNSVSIAAPESNPASDRTLYLPSNADGTIVTSTSPDADRFKAGEIVQVQTATFKPSTNSPGTLTDGTYTNALGDTGLTWTFTPKFSDSILIIELNVETKLNDEDGYARWAIYDNTNTAYFHSAVYCGASHYYSSTSAYLPSIIRAKGNALNTSARTYSLRVGVWSGGTLTFNWSNEDDRLITTTEIKQ
tara:strand:+ start:16 stop:612 length:597 start_codon:yes stop_codon:yes gene_type:complete